VATCYKSQPKARVTTKMISPTRPHQGSVDADVLKTLADLKLQPVHKGFGIPSCHELGDECADLSAVRHDGAQDEPRSLIVALM